MPTYEKIRTRREHSKQKYNINKVSVFLRNCTEARMIKRMRQLKDNGFKVLGFSFRRRRYNDDYVPEWDNIHLGDIAHEKYCRRILAICRSMLLIFKYRKELRDVDLFYANMLDPALLALFARVISVNTAPIIYEVSDIYLPFVQRDIMGYGVRLLEKVVLRHIRCLVVTSPGFMRNYYWPIQNYNKEWFLLENKIYPPIVSSKDSQSSSASEPTSCQDSSELKWVIGYFGTLRCVKSWEMIKLLAREIPEKVEFYLRGVSLRINQRDFFRTLEDFSNIKYGGEYRYPEDLPQIYNAIHLTWCIDLSQSWYNSRWLLPNGFYESGLFAVPMLSLKGFEVGDLVEELDIGWAISQPYISFLIEFLKQLTWQDYVYKKERLARVPKSYFQGNDQFKKMCDVIRKPIPC